MSRLLCGEIKDRRAHPSSFLSSPIHLETQAMNLESNEIILIYNSNSLKDREAKAYAEAMDNRKLRTIDIAKMPLTAMQLKQIAKHLNVSSEEMMDTSSEVYLNYFKNASLSEDDIFKAIVKNSSLMKTPIALYKYSGGFVSTPKDFINEDRAHEKLVEEHVMETEDH